MKEFIERLLLAVLPEPERLTGLQVARHGDEFGRLAEIDLVDPQLPQHWLLSRCGPASEIAQVDRSNRTGGQPEPPRHLIGRGTLAGLPHRLSKRLLNGALLGNCA